MDGGARLIPDPNQRRRPPPAWAPDSAPMSQPPADPEFHTYPVESSWTSFREKKPLWMRATIFAVVAMALGAILAHLQGRAVWQGGSIPAAASSSAPAG